MGVELGPRPVAEVYETAVQPATSPAFGRLGKGLLRGRTAAGTVPGPMTSKRGRRRPSGASFDEAKDLLALSAVGLCYVRASFYDCFDSCSELLNDCLNERWFRVWACPDHLGGLTGLRQFGAI